MKRYVEVYWCPFFIQGPGDLEKYISLELLVQEPKPLINKLFVERKNTKYLQCPAVIDNLKNTFVIEAPFDLVYSVNKESKTSSTDRFGQDFFEKFTLFRYADTLPNYPTLLTLPPKLMFYSKVPVIAELMDVPILQSETTRNTKVIPGQYDISKWVRPIDWTFELHVGDTVRMRKGDALLAVKFNTVNNLPVKLVRVKNNENLVNTAHACTSLKEFCPKLNLKTVYNLAKDFLRTRGHK